MTGPEGKTVPFLRRFLNGWHTLARLIGSVNTMLLLGIVFFLVVTPIGILMRPFRKGILLGGSDGWVRRPEGGSRERQF
jgi:hypothetical protein